MQKMSEVQQESRRLEMGEYEGCVGVSAAMSLGGKLGGAHRNARSGHRRLADGGALALVTGHFSRYLGL